MNDILETMTLNELNDLAREVKWILGSKRPSSKKFEVYSKLYSMISKQKFLISKQIIR